MRKRTIRISALLLALALLMALPAMALEPGQAEVNATDLNFREEPGMDGRILAVLPSDAVVEVLGRN